MILDHATIRTRNLKNTRDFFINVFYLEEKPRPQVIQKIPGHWLFFKNQPFIHLIQSLGNLIDNSIEGIDHIGIKLNDYKKYKQKLKKLNIQFSLMDIEELNERRIFFRTPDHILLETIFHKK